ncbi:hypothetical protein Droror1_Dr00025817 [Drosera rotundifolia]
MRRESVANLPTIASIITEMDVFVPSPGIALFAKLILILATSKLKARHRVFQVLVDMEEMELGYVVWSASGKKTRCERLMMPSKRFNILHFCCGMCHRNDPNPNPLTSLSCDHTFDSECLFNWAKYFKGCPICETPLPSFRSRARFSCVSSLAFRFQLFMYMMGSCIRG